jgi:predicted signal transduction protein with EAL and GGDEF domain
VAVIRSTVDLAHSLGLRIVAEGIENLDALALVDDLGCDAAQGYLMGRPVPAEEFDLGPVALKQPGKSKHVIQLVATRRRLSKGSAEVSDDVPVAGGLRAGQQ